MVILNKVNHNCTREIIKIRSVQFTSNYRPQRSWGKVIFSQARVILFTGGGVVPGPGGVVLGPGGCLVENPPRTATAAGGTHPTGMHSCFLLMNASWNKYILNTSLNTIIHTQVYEYITHTMCIHTSSKFNCQQSIRKEKETKRTPSFQENGGYDGCHQSKAISTCTECCEPTVGYIWGGPGAQTSCG